MKLPEYDVVVVGAGNGGLAAAATFAKAGKKVLVLEKHNLPGGTATSFVRGRFEFEPALHEMCQVGEGASSGAVRKLLDDEFGLDVEWVPVNEAFRTISTEKMKEYDVTMPVGVQEFIDEMDRAVPGSRQSINTVMELCRMICDGAEWMESHSDPGVLDKLKILLKYRDLMKTVPVTCDEMLRRIGVPDKARQIFESYWDYICADSQHVSFAIYATMIYSYLSRKPYIVKNRSHELSMAFDTMIRQNGGEIWYNTPVKKINVRGGEVHGVTLADNTFILSKWVMCNVMPHTVWGKMVDPEEVPVREKKLMNARKIGSCCITVYIALDIPYKELGFKGYDTFLRHTGDNHAQYESSRTLESHKDNCITIINEVIPDCTPEGTCMVQFSRFFTDEAWTEEFVREENYWKVKEKFADETIRQFEEYTGRPVRDHIEEIVIASPLTWARYLNTPYGDVYGYEPRTWDGMFARVRSGRDLDYTIKGLRFCGGHGTHMDGYSQAYLSGHEQAGYMLDEMKKMEEK